MWLRLFSGQSSQEPIDGQPYIKLEIHPSKLHFPARESEQFRPEEQEYKVATFTSLILSLVKL